MKTKTPNSAETVTLNGSNYPFAYDTKGSLTNDGSNNVLLGNYSFRNLPTTMNNFSYTYNDSGERIKKLNIDSSYTEYYLRDYLGRELVIYNYETNDPKQVNIYGNGLVGKIEIDTTETRSYYLKDHLGSVRSVVDNNSSLISAQDYYPYGELLREYNSANQRYQLTEKERDNETNYDYFGARYYNSKLGVWLQVDPLSEKYPGWSPYAYTLCNPLRYTDPNGMDTTSVNANASYDAETDIETITETTVEHINPGTKDFAVVTTTNTATIDSEGNIVVDQTVESMTNAGVSTYSNPNATVANFSKQVGGIVQKASTFRTTKDLSWSQTFVKEYNVVRARRDNKELGFNIITSFAFPPNFSSVANSAVSIGNLGISAYGIYGVSKDNSINPNSNLKIRIK